MILAFGLAADAEAAGADPPANRVRVVRAPAGAIQPQAAVDAQGRVHLIAFRGDAVAGDVDYVRLAPDGMGFTDPVRVNSIPRTVIARGTIRGAQLAVGRDGRVHVAWNGPQDATPANPLGGAPMLYSRLDPATGAFEPQRNLMTRSTALDGGGTIAADAEGRVLVAWHGRPEGAPQGEVHRRLLVARSNDDGATFAPEEPAVDRPTGACACCGTRALAAPDGALYLLFREVGTGGDRQIDLLFSRDRGRTFDVIGLDNWKIATCPMSSASLAAGPNGVVAGWETQGQVFFAPLDPRSGRPAGPPVHPRGVGGNRKHPALAVNHRGEVLIAWTEETSFQRGGSLHWRVYDPNGKPTPEEGRVADGIPRDSLPTALALPGGGFLIVH